MLTGPGTRYVDSLRPARARSPLDARSSSSPSSRAIAARSAVRRHEATRNPLAPVGDVVDDTRERVATTGFPSESACTTVVCPKSEDSSRSGTTTMRAAPDQLEEIAQAASSTRSSTFVRSGAARQATSDPNVTIRSRALCRDRFVSASRSRARCRRPRRCSRVARATARRSPSAERHEAARSRTAGRCAVDPCLRVDDVPVDEAELLVRRDEAGSLRRAWPRRSKPEPPRPDEPRHRPLDRAEQHDARAPPPNATSARTKTTAALTRSVL